jgi:hypothetical protein
MHTCVICRFDVPADDAVAPTTSGLCVCLRCYMRRVGTERRMPMALRRELDGVVAAVPTA